MTWLPSLDENRSIQVIADRLRHLPGVTGQDFDWGAYFIRHEANTRLARHVIYTDGQTPAQTCTAVLAAVDQHPS